MGGFALRTIPKNGNKKLKVNALLDDASTKTYLNTDVAAELDLQGEVQKISVSVLNGQVETFETGECIIESLDGKVQSKVNAFTTGRVTGNMRATDWNSCVDKWPHLRGIQFYKLGPRSIVDVLIGLDCADLNFSYKDVRGNPGQPVARPTPLGWTCIGPLGEGQDCEQMNFARTYFSTGQTEISKMNVILHRFWEIDCSGVESFPVMKDEDRIVLNKAQESIKFVDGRYRIETPWNNTAVELPNNYSMALNRLSNLEKRLQRSSEMAREYQATKKDIWKKGTLDK